VLGFALELACTKLAQSVGRGNTDLSVAAVSSLKYLLNADQFAGWNEMEREWNSQLLWGSEA